MGEGRLVPVVCQRCLASFVTPERGLRRGRGRFCSVECATQNANDLRWNVHHEHPNLWFWDLLDRSGGDNACWIWTRTTARRGYGRLIWNGKSIQAHRMAKILAHGEPPAKHYFACHHCDNPPCCNPRHLWWGTHKDNMNDRDAKGRTRGRQRSIDPALASQMRADGVSVEGIADHFKVTTSSIYRCLRARASLLSADPTTSA